MRLISAVMPMFWLKATSSRLCPSPSPLAALRADPKFTSSRPSMMPPTHREPWDTSQSGTEVVERLEPSQRWSALQPFRELETSSPISSGLIGRFKMCPTMSGPSLESESSRRETYKAMDKVSPYKVRRSSVVSRERGSRCTILTGHHTMKNITENTKALLLRPSQNHGV